jgi:hypothetical protein
MRLVDDSFTILYVTVNLTNDGHAASVDVELQQAIRLLRDPTIMTLATTWSVGGVIVNPSVQGIRNSVKDKVDEFLNGWLSVNPQGSPSQN